MSSVREVVATGQHAFVDKRTSEVPMGKTGACRRWHGMDCLMRDFSQQERTSEFNEKWIIFS